jgi:hypothetical protein
VKRRGLGVPIVLFAFLCLRCDRGPVPDSPGEVPSRFASLSAELTGTLDQFARLLDTLPARRTGVIFGGEVLPANSHRGEDLLSDGAYQGCLLYVDRLKALGAGGVTVAMDYPLLNADYPRSAEYWSFYRRLAGDIKARGLRLNVKVGPIFTDRNFSNVRVDYSNLTLDEYFRDRGRIAQRIALEIRPDYLSIGNEPSTEAEILHLEITPDRFVRYVNETLAGMNRSVTLVGAGAGTWDSTDYVQRFARQTSLDYIDLHIYPLGSLGGDYLRRAAEMADIAAAGGKRVIIGEAWLYKAGRLELTIAPTAPVIFARDVYSFWAPLDARFLQEIGRLASLKRIEYVSPFWTKYLFAYLPFDDRTSAATAAQLFSMSDQEAVKQLTAGGYSVTGEAYRDVISRYQ